MAHLELDVGNTALKWRLCEDERRISGGRVPNKSVADLPFDGVTEAWVGSVAGEQFNRTLRDELAAQGVTARFASSQQRCGRVQNSYADVSRMGVDRWLAMVAAYYRAGQRAVVVVDAGTALTIDIVAGDGQHLGGYILPGAPLMVRSLGLATDRVKVEVSSTNDLSPGRNTGACVANGCALAQLGAIKQAVSEAQAELRGSPAVMVTGGDGHGLWELGRSESTEWEYVEELVLDGLAPVVRASGER